jgi:hypothetical protein
MHFFTRKVTLSTYLDSLVLIYNSLKSQPGYPHPIELWL